MKFEKLENWLESGAAGEYNMIEDTQELVKDGHSEVLDYGKIDNPYEKFFIYKYCKMRKTRKTDWENLWDKMKEGERGETAERTKKEFEEKAERYKDIKDPDESSDLLQEIYKILWPELTKQEFMMNKKNSSRKGEYGKIASDAMTSVQRNLGEALHKEIGKENKPEDMKEEIYELLQKMMCGVFKNNKKNWTVLFCAVAVAELSAVNLDKEFYEWIDRNVPALGEFIHRCFTVGNYCPVPGGFNVPRSGPDAKYDYWDLTLMKIREWYYNDNKFREKLLREQLLHNHKNADPLKCKEWLEWFEEKGKKEGKDGWHCFVDTLFMQDYVYEDYNVKPFWKGHGWEEENIELPEDIDKINQGLEEINIRIAARSVRIINACREKLAGEYVLRQKGNFML